MEHSQRGVAVYILFSTKLEIRTVSAWKRGSRGERERRRQGVGRRNDPNIVCTYE
jgi:hypothetical protein